MRKGLLVEAEEEEVGEEVDFEEVGEEGLVVEEEEALVVEEVALVDVEVVVAVEDSEEVEVEVVDVDLEVDDDEGLCGYAILYYHLQKKETSGEKAEAAFGTNTVFRLLLDASLVQLNFFTSFVPYVVFSAVEFLFVVFDRADVLSCTCLCTRWHVSPTNLTCWTGS